MRQTLLFLVIACFITIPTYAQHDETCVIDVTATLPELADDWFTNEEWDQDLTSWAVDYLNAGTSVDTLAATIEQTAPYLMDANTLIFDVNNDSNEDIIVSTLIAWDSYYNFHLGIYSCEAGTYRLLDEMRTSAEGRDAAIELVADTNNNQLPEIIVRLDNVPRKYYEALFFYEWNNESLESVFSTEWQYGGYGPVFLRNYDDDPATIELIIGRLYSYGESSASAYIELWLHRSVDQVYIWTGETYELFCEYFADEPDVLFQAVHSAESYRQCGNFGATLAMYRQIVNDYRAYYEGTPQFESESGENSLDPTRMEYQNGADFERDYTTAFAYYRMLQIYLATGEAEYEINRHLENMHELFPAGKRGHRYAAMADTFYTEYTQSGDMDAACQAAEATFNAVRDTEADPIIPYQGNNIPFNPDDPTWIPPFYYKLGSSYSTDPDNLFLPDGMDGVIFIPVCL